MTEATFHCECPEQFCHGEGDCPMRTPLYHISRRRHAWRRVFLGARQKLYVCSGCRKLDDVKVQGTEALLR